MFVHGSPGGDRAHADSRVVQAPSGDLFDLLIPGVIRAGRPGPASRAGSGQAGGPEACLHVRDIGAVERTLTHPLCLECSPGEASLEHGLTAGDDRAFALLVARETDDVFRICYRVLGNRKDASAASEAVFLSAHRALGAYPAGLRPGAWVASIAAREAWKRWASRSTDGAVSTVVPDEDDPEHGGMDALERAQVRHCVSRLPEPSREIVMLWFYARLSLQDIAAATKCSEELVVEEIRNGLRLMRDLIGETVA